MSNGSAAPVARDTVSDSVKVLTAEAAKANPKAAAAKAKAETGPSNPKAKASSEAPQPPPNKEKVKAEEKPKAAETSNQKPKATEPTPAQVPSASTIGGVQPVASTPAEKAKQTQPKVAKDDRLQNTAKAEDAPTSTSQPAAPPRTQGAQMMGAAPGDGMAQARPAIISSAAAKAASGYREPAPPQAVEKVTRQPVQSSISAPPATAQLPGNLPRAGDAAALAQIAQT